jgi:hybrid cluster-associated redox disulfide protein
MHHPHLRADNSVAEVMERWPQSLPVFLHRHMACVGCAMSTFCTLDQAACAYHLDSDSFLNELELALRQTHSETGESS